MRHERVKLLGSCIKEELPRGAVVMWEFHCEGVAVCLGHGGYQTIVMAYFGVFNFFACILFRKKINNLKKLQFAWLIFQGIWNRQGCQCCLDSVSIQF